MDKSMFYGYDKDLHVTRTEHLEVRSAVAAGGVPMIEVVATVGPKQVTVFVPLRDAERLAAAVRDAGRDAEAEVPVG